MPEETTETPAGFVPVARLSGETRLKNEATASLATSQARVTELEGLLSTANTAIGTHADTLANHASAVEGWASKEQEWATTRSIYQTGLTDESGIEIAKLLHGKISNAPPIADWLEGFKADPASAPKGLASWFNAAPAAAPTPAPVAAAPPAPAPAPTPAPSTPAAGTAPSSGAEATGQVISADAIRAASEQMLLGNRAPYEAMRKLLPTVKS